MPFIAIDSDIRISYRDSGKPQQDVYTTFIIIHGHTFHSNVMRRMFPLALAKGVRLICPDRRDYCESTKFGKEDNRVLAEGTDAERKSFMEARGVEYALFVDRIIDELSLPKPTADRKDGGVSLVGWSLGNMSSIAIIASAPALPKRILQRLQEYLRNLVIYSGPNHSLGIPNPPGAITPMEDETVPPEDLGRVFVKWVSSYYTHGDISTRDRAVLNTNKPDTSPKATIETMSPEDLMSVVDFAPGKASEGFLTTEFGTPLLHQTEKVLFDPRLRSEYWPNLEVWSMYGDREVWNVLFAGFEIEARSKAAGLDVKVHVSPGVNHFLVWDEPEKSLDALMRTVQN